MKQVISKSEYHVLWTFLGRFGDILGGQHDVFASDTYGSVTSRVPLPIPGTIRKFTLYSGAAQSLDVTATLRKNDADTALAALIPAGVTGSAVNTASELTVAAGDDVNVRYNNPAGPNFGATGKDFGTSIEFEGAANVYGLSGIRGGSADDCWGGGGCGDGVLAFIGGLPSDGSSPAGLDYDLCALDGVIDKVCIKELSSTASGGSWTAYVRINGILQANPVTLTDGEGFHVGTVGARCAPADHVQIVVVRNTTSGPAEIAVGHSFVPDEAGAFMLSGGAHFGSLGAGADAYTWSGDVAGSDAVAAGPFASQVFITGLYVEMGNPASGSWLARLQVSGAPTGASVMFLPGSDGSESITGLSIPINSSDYADILARPDNPGTSLPLKWALAVSTAEPPTEHGTIGELSWIHTRRTVP